MERFGTVRDQWSILYVGITTFEDDLPLTVRPGDDDLTGIVGSRILVHESIHEEFLEEFKKVVQQIVVGKDPKAFYGSLISKVQFDKVMEYIEIGKKEAKLELGGARHGDKGYFVQPTVFSNVTNQCRIAQEEIFGPVATIIKFKDEAEALKIANDTI